MTADLEAAVAPVADALDELGVSYYLSGSVMSSVYGIGRSTADVDIVTALAPSQAQAFVDRLGDAYYVDLDAVRDAIARNSMFNVIHQATLLKVDVYIVATDFDRSALARRLADTITTGPDARRFAVATAEDVILHKLLWYRSGGHVSERQWGDVLGVLRVQPHLDLAFLRTWAARLGVEDLLERALAEAAT